MADSTSTSTEQAASPISANPVSEMLDNVQDILKGDRVSRVRIKLGDRVLKEIPMEAAAFTALVVVLAAVVISRLHIEVVREKAEGSA